MAGVNMYLDLNKLYKQSGFMKKDLANIAGISRMSVCKTTAESTKNTIFVSDAKYYDIHRKLPQYVPLPEDFFHYTRPILMLNKYLYHVDTKTLYDKLSKYKVRGYRVYFLYSNKKEIDELFPNLILPYYIDANGKTVPYQGEGFCNANAEEGGVLQYPFTYEQFLLKYPGVEKDLYDRFSPLNIRANTIIYNMQIKDAQNMFDRNISGDIRFHHPISFIRDREMLERVFSPYIFLRPEDLEKLSSSETK